MPHLVARLRDWPGRRAAAAEVEAAEEDGEVVLEHRRDGRRREEVLPRRHDGLQVKLIVELSRLKSNLIRVRCSDSFTTK